MHKNCKQLMALGGLAIAALVPSGLHAAANNANTPQITVLSNRPDLVSGGNALVQIAIPQKSGTLARVELNGSDVTLSFAVRDDGRTYGLVSGLTVGPNRLVARGTMGPAAEIIITNHSIGGPVISGPQVQPWICQTTNSPSLGPPVDEKCNAPTAYRFMYRTTGGQFAAFNPSAPPPADMATTTTETGETLPYVVRIERGTMNRGIHEIAVLYDPARPWTPWMRQPQWNQKVYVPFGSGCEFSHYQGNPGSVLSDFALRRGFLVMSSSNTQYGTHCSDVVSAETVLMLKEHVTETYGEIRFTVSSGGSGGAHQQHLHISNYPGLLQGIIPDAAFQDTWTPYREFADCGLLARFYANRVTAPWLEIQKAATDGHSNASTCEGPVPTYMASRTAAYLDPMVGSGCQGQPWTYHPVTNPNGARCTLQDYNVAVFGKRPDGFAKRALDNIGVQYGLDAFNTGIISADMFVDLNASIGCYDIDAKWQPARCVADAGAVRIAHASGRVTHGRQMANAAIIDRRDNDFYEEHYNFRSYVTRNRLLKVHGSADNMAIWRTTTGTAPDLESAFVTMNAWLELVAADDRDVPLARKIVDNRPPLARDTCFEGSDAVDATICDAVYRTFTDTRVAAGEPPASDIMKCQLKPLDRGDYTQAISDALWARMQSIFPTGVCDYRLPGVDQVEPMPWQTFMDGPGGQPLPPAPVSQRVED